MKTKKLIMAVVALTMSATVAVSIAGCSHKHEYADWTQTKAPTCTEEGEETGTCAKDGATQIRKIAPTGHSYGAWQVTAPTATEPGTATKICANGTHPLVVSLPATTSTEYEVSHKTTAGVTKGGVDTYTLAHAEGAISFDVGTAAKGVTDFGDVILATAENTDRIRSGIVTVPDAVQGAYTYEYGDGYTHVNKMIVAYNKKAGSNQFVGSEYFIDKNSDGSDYAVVADCLEFDHNGTEYVVTKYNVGIASSLADLAEVALFKEGYYVTVNNTVYSYQSDENADDYMEKTFASVEYYLGWLYGISQANANGSVISTWNKETGVCKLQFSYMGTAKAEKLGEDGRKVYEITNPDPNGNGVDYTEDADDLPLLQYNDTPVFENVPALVTVDVNFTVNENYVITSFDSTVKNYLQRTLEAAATQPDASTIPEYLCEYPDTKVYEAIPYFTLDGGAYVLTNEAQVNFEHSYTATQVAKQTGDAVPENPYAPSRVGVNGFELYDSKYDWTGQYSLQQGPDGQPEKIYDWIKNEKITDPANVGVTKETNSDPLKIYVDDVTPSTAIANLNTCTLVIIDAQGTKSTLGMPTGTDGIYGWYDANESCIYVKNYVNLGDYTLQITIGNATKTLKIKYEPMAPTLFVAKMNSYDEAASGYVVANATKADVFVGEAVTLFVEASGDAGCAVASGYSATVKDANGDPLATSKYTVVTNEIDVAEGVTSYTYRFTDAGEYTVTLTADKGGKSCDVAVTVSAVPTLTEILTGNLLHKASSTSAAFDTTANTVTVTVDGKTATYSYTYNTETKAFTLTFTGGSNELNNGTVAMQINLKNHVVLTYTYGVPEPLVYVLTVPSGNPVDEAYDAITSGSWSLSSEMLTYTFSKDGFVSAGSPMAGYETWNYTLVDKGDGTFAVNFTGDDAGFTGIWPDDNATGSWIKVENGVVTEFHFLYADGFGGTTAYTLTAV